MYGDDPVPDRTISEWAAEQEQRVRALRAAFGIDRPDPPPRKKYKHRPRSDLPFHPRRRTPVVLRNGRERREFASANAAADALGLTPGAVRQACHLGKTIGGWSAEWARPTGKRWTRHVTATLARCA